VGNRPTTVTDPSGLLWVLYDGKLYYFDMTREEFVKKFGAIRGWQIIDGQVFTAYASVGGFTEGMKYYLVPDKPFAVPIEKVIRKLADQFHAFAYKPGDERYMVIAGACMTAYSAAAVASSWVGFLAALAKDQIEGYAQDYVIGKAVEKFDEITTCFAAGTPVWTREGLKPIEEIQPGEMVLSYNVETGEVEYKGVIRTSVNEASESLLVMVEGEASPLRVTTEHPFFVQDACQADRGGWVAARKLSAGDKVRQPNGGWRRIASVTYQAGHLKVYNFEVADNHNYFVSRTGILVHNQSTEQSKTRQTKDGGRFTEPDLSDRVIVNEDGVTIEHYTRSGDHGPPHAHVSGNGPDTRIGQGGKPLKGDAELSAAQRKVINANKSAVRKALKQIGKWYRFNRM
jgi:hypothetical protein